MTSGRPALKVGDLITNPVHGETVRWLALGSEDAVTKFEFRAEPQASGPPPHIHPKSEERFEVLSGAIMLKSGREKREVGSGEKICVPQGISHTWHNHTDEPALVVVEMDPGFTTAQFLDEWYELARSGRLNNKGDVGFLRSALLFHAHLDAMAIPGIPLSIQRLLMRGIGWVAQKRGLD